MTIDNMEAYKKNNIKLIKQYLKKLLKMDYISIHALNEECDCKISVI